MRKAKALVFASLLVIGLVSCTPQAEVKTEVRPQNSTGYDSELALELGADEYGMRSYVMVILKTGPADITDAERRQEIFAGHFSNMGILAKEGKLVLAGPFMDAGDKRGLYIFNVATIEEAKEIVLTDPAVAAGIFTPEFTKYYGSAALMQVNAIHTKIQKTKIE